MATNPAADSSPAAPSTADHDQVINEVGVMRAMSHPARIAILEHLGQNGPSTATECAAVVGLSPSATSYHLRALARAGLVDEAPSRGDARERVWRSTVAGGFSVSAGPDATLEARQAEDALIETFLAWEDTQTRQFLAKRDREPAEWYHAVGLSQTTIVATLDELRALNDAIVKLVRPYRKRDRTDPPPGARTVSIMIRSFPTDEPPGE